MLAELVKQVIAAGQSAGVQILAENALEGGIYNAEALQRMKDNAPNFQRITLLRLSPGMFAPSDSSPERLRVVEPLESFLNAFRKPDASG